MQTGNTDFRRYLEEAIGQDNAAVAFSAFSMPASVSVRINPFKVAAGFSWSGREVAWSRYGLVLDARPVFTLDPCLHGGAYYVQDSSSMFVGYVFRQVLAGRFCGMQRPLRVLDLCAAPGGKTTDLAASLRQACGDSFILVANEVMRQRASVLADNVALWGDPNVMVTSADPSAFAKLRGWFDIILADVPCSGEGMFRKDDEAVAQWSMDNVALCQARQRRIAGDVWGALADGGVMIYSTCTFNRYENDLNVEWIAGELGAEIVSSEIPDMPGVLRTGNGWSLVPGLVGGEGQYCAVLCKNACGDVFREGRLVRRKEQALHRGLHDLFDRDVTVMQRGDTVIAVPSALVQDADVLSSVIRPVSCGCAVGVFKGRDLVPDADLALSYMLSGGAFPSAELSFDEALAFLHRDTIVLADAPKGYVKVCYEGLPLGFVKNLGNRCNNLHPQGRRIRMDISGKTK